MTVIATPGAGGARLQGSRPYPWPFDGALVGAGTAVVVTGAQPAWVDRSVGVEDVTAAIEAVVAAVRGAGGHVVVVRHAASSARHGRIGLPPDRGSGGWALAPSLPDADVVVDAGGVDGFTASPLDHELRRRGITRLVMTGFGAEATVDSTLRSANDRGYECLTLTDAVAPFDPATGAAALASITMSGGIFGAVAATSELLAALSHSSPQEVST